MAHQPFLEGNKSEKDNSYLYNTDIQVNLMIQWMPYLILEICKHQQR